MVNQRIHDLKVTYRATSALTPYPGNPRRHSKKQIVKIAKRITDRFINPIICDENLMILAGHGRWEAAKYAGLVEVPVIIVAGLSETEKRAYILSDNRLGDESEFSKKQLKIELEALIELDGDLTLTSFDSFEIDTMLAIEPDEPKDEEDVYLDDDEMAPVTCIGDVWYVGEHRVICGDARDPQVYEKLLTGERAQQVFTDPPYGCPIANFASGLGKTRHADFVAGAGEEALPEFSRNLLRPAFKLMAAHALPGTIGYIFSDWRAAPYVHDAAKGIFAEQKNLAIFVKTNAGMGAFLRSQHELVHIFKLVPGKHINNMGLSRGRSNVWVYPGANVFRKGRMADLADHATIKPRRLCEDAIVDTSRRGGLVLDAFAGSGTTLSAAHIVGRRGRGIELDPKFVDVILRRLSEVVGKVPMLDGVTPFDEVARARRADRAGDQA